MGWSDGGLGSGMRYSMENFVRSLRIGFVSICALELIAYS